MDDVVTVGAVLLRFCQQYYSPLTVWLHLCICWHVCQTALCAPQEKGWRGADLIGRDGRQPHQ